LKESFRQNPDYVIVGETRGSETYVMFQGMASGHSSLSTFHAGSIDTVIKRLTSPPIELSPTLIESLDTIAVIVHAREKGKSARRIKEVVEVESVDAKTGEVKTVPIFTWNPSTDTFEKVNESIKVKKFVTAKGGRIEDALAEIERRKKILEWLRAKGIKDYLEVTKIINLYYKEPRKVFEMIGEEVEKPLAPLPPRPKVEEKPKKSLLELLGFKVVREK
jgi:flagellar protein FlaI